MTFFQDHSDAEEGQDWPPDDGVDWEFGPDDYSAGLGTGSPQASPYAPPRPATTSREGNSSPFSGPDSNLLAPFRGTQAAARVESVKRGLDAALERWWQSGELAAPGMLRDGLLALEAGHDLPESQRSLLLRSAIHLRRGMLTALAHQTDPERTALILSEAMFDTDSTLSAETVDYLRLHDASGAEWAPLLVANMVEMRDNADGERRRRIDNALAYMEGERPVAAAADPFIEGEAAISEGRWSATRRVVLLAAVAFLVVAALWQLRRYNAQEMVLIPDGEYWVRTQEGQTRMVRVRNTLVDRTEVTNHAYRRCFEQGVCPWPTANDSATRSDYFLDTAFDVFPVVNVDRGAATVFCRWLGKRLPSAEEWQVAAAVAPATGLYYAYPWGNQYQQLAANGSRSGHGDTIAVGQYRPVGDSPFGLSDMAGNVAEWVAPSSGDSVPGSAIVKGGSFQDGPDGLLASAQREVPADFSAPWLGFRCAQSRGSASTP